MSTNHMSACPKVLLTQLEVDTDYFTKGIIISDMSSLISCENIGEIQNLATKIRI